MKQRHFVICLLAIALLFLRSANAYYRSDEGAMWLAMLTFCIQRTSDTEKQVIFAKGINEVLPSYIESLKGSNNKDGFVAKTFLSHMQQFSTWNSNLVQVMCEDAYTSSKKDFEPKQVEKK